MTRSESSDRTSRIVSGEQSGTANTSSQGGQNERPGSNTTRLVGLILGPVLFFALLLLPIPGLSATAQAVLGLTAWMAAWWVTEAIPVGATALLPLVLFPLFGADDLIGVEQNYSDNSILLIFGTLLIARGITKAGIAERVALKLLGAVGDNALLLVGGLMAVCAGMSAWISAAATAAIMLPVAVAVIGTVKDDEQQKRFGKCLVLGVVYASTLGVLSTIIATPPNAVFASLAPSLLGFEIGFGQWMLVGVPMAVVGVTICWAYLSFIVAPVKGVSLKEGSRAVDERLEELGPTSRDEKLVLAIFLTTVALWITRSLVWGDLLPNVNNTSIAMLGAIALFLVPSENGGRLLDWKTAVGLPWAVLLLMGGGLALAFGYTALGIDVWIADQLGFLGGLASVWAIAAIALLTIVVGEIMSNAATAALLIPVAAALAPTIGIDPVQLTFAVALAASFGFMLPISAANAVALSTGKVTTPDLVKAGLPMNLLGVVLVTLACYTIVPLVFGR